MKKKEARKNGVKANKQKQTNKRKANTPKQVACVKVIGVPVPGF